MQSPRTENQTRVINPLFPKFTNQTKPTTTLFTFPLANEVTCNQALIITILSLPQKNLLYKFLASVDSSFKPSQNIEQN
jgi:hypothetical protein